MTIEGDKRWYFAIFLTGSIQTLAWFFLMEFSLVGAFGLWPGTAAGLAVAVAASAPIWFSQRKYAATIEDVTLRDRANLGGLVIVEFVVMLGTVAYHFIRA